MMAHVSAIASAADLPVSADLENGYGDTPEIVAETIRLAAAAGLVGGSIEDATGLPGPSSSMNQEEHAVERVRAAAEVVPQPSFCFHPDRTSGELTCTAGLTSETRFERLQAYQEAGADVLYAPGLTTKTDIATLVQLC